MPVKFKSLLVASFLAPIGYAQGFVLDPMPSSFQSSFDLAIEKECILPSPSGEYDWDSAISLGEAADILARLLSPDSPCKPLSEDELYQVLHSVDDLRAELSRLERELKIQSQLVAGFDPTEALGEIKSVKAELDSRISKLESSLANDTYLGLKLGIDGEDVFISVSQNSENFYYGVSGSSSPMVQGEFGYREKTESVEFKAGLGLGYDFNKESFRAEITGSGQLGIFWVQAGPIWQDDFGSVIRGGILIKF